MNAQTRRLARRAQARTDSKYTVQQAMRLDLRKSKALPLTATQRDSTGAHSDWSRSQTINPFTTPMMRSWDYTVGNKP